MIGLVMAGGKGTRMKSNEEKLLLNYKQPLVLHVIAVSYTHLRAHETLR